MFIEEFKGIKPTISKTAKIFPSAVVAGNVVIGDFVGIWYNATVRGDMAAVKIGKNTNVQDNAVIHTNTGHPTIIGENVTIGHNAIVHACTVEDNALIGMGSIVLDGAVIGEGSLVGAGCVVPPNKIVPSHTLVIGNPMRIIRTLTADEIEGSKSNADHYVELMNDFE